jgi:phosphonate transport system substrate-binding protein
MNRKAIYIGSIIVIILILLGFWGYYTKHNTIIDFNKTEAIPEYQVKNKEVPLRIAMVSVLSHADTAKYQNQLADSIGRLLNRPVLVLRRKSYAEINQLLNKGDADIGLLSTGAYCVYGKKEELTLLAMQQRNNLPYYYSYIIVPADSTDYTFEDLRGKNFAYVDPLSYSGFFSVQARLQKIGITQDVFFNSYSFIYSHDASIRAVAKKFVAGAAIDSLAYDYLLKYRPQIASKIRIIEILPPRGTGPIVARKGLIDEKKIQQVLLHIHEDKTAKDALDHLLIDKFILPEPSLYPTIDWYEKEVG